MAIKEEEAVKKLETIKEKLEELMFDVLESEITDVSVEVSTKVKHIRQRTIELITMFSEALVGVDEKSVIKIKEDFLKSVDKVINTIVKE